MKITIENIDDEEDFEYDLHGPGPLTFIAHPDGGASFLMTNPLGDRVYLPSIKTHYRVTIEPSTRVAA